MVAVGGVGAFAHAAETDVGTAARLLPPAAVRVARDVAGVGAIVLDYRRSLRGLAEGSAARERAKAECHARSARRLRDLCFANGGIYIKLGQHVGQLDYLLPEEYVRTMRESMLDRCPTSTPADVRAIVEKDLGRPLEALYRSFDAAPLASASLAQVHAAETLEGVKVAVKVQHAGLRENSVVDVATVQALVTAVRFVYPDFNYQWLVDEIQANLPKELDFLHEAANARECAANLRASPTGLGARVEVPGVHDALSSSRVLTMDFAEGVSPTDVGALAGLGVRPGEVATLIARTFAEMTFIHGFVHCDPHEANMLVRSEGGRARLVLLDHGLYRHIDDAFRINYAGLWESMIFADEAGIKRHSESLNAGELYPLLACMLTAKPWSQIMRKDINHLTADGTAEERQTIQDGVVTYFGYINQLLGEVPRELLLLLKTNDCLRAVDSALGQPVNNYIITARQCSKALSEVRATSTLTAFFALRDRLAIEFRLFALRLLAWGAAFSRAEPPAGAAGLV